MLIYALYSGGRARTHEALICAPEASCIWSDGLVYSTASVPLWTSRDSSPPFSWSSLSRPVVFGEYYMQTILIVFFFLDCIALRLVELWETTTWTSVRRGSWAMLVVTFQFLSLTMGSKGLHSFTCFPLFINLWIHHVRCFKRPSRSYNQLRPIGKYRYKRSWWRPYSTK